MKKQASGRSKTEDVFAHALWKAGIRYRRNYKALPGKPDIAITKYKIAVFVDGEFWHGKDWEKRKNMIKRNRDYWIPKIERTRIRDQHDDILLKEVGWLPLHFWGRDVLKYTEYYVEYVKYVIEHRDEIK